MNAETVKYFSMEEWESERYKVSIKAFQVTQVPMRVDQVEEWKTNASLAFLNFAQTIVLNCALLALTLFCAYLVKRFNLCSTSRLSGG